MEDAAWKNLWHGRLVPCISSGMQVNMRAGGVESEANVTDIHEALHFDVMEERDSGYHHSFGIWSLRWGSDGREIVAGTGDHSLYVYNVERQKVKFFDTTLWALYFEVLP